MSRSKTHEKAKKLLKKKLFLKKGIDKRERLCYTIIALVHGGIAQLARATGSYPVGHGFKSNSRYQRPVGQAAKTPPFHGGNGSSILPRVTKKDNIRTRFGCYLFIQAAGLAWNHASACMESPKAYGITEGAFPAA